ncbi:MAG: class I SAM-dependent methyltransferase [Elusimicrobiota bacterium]|nr:class I SAM-dependent methyltransferase [Endomicrobiia bacterium]MDW8166529.1 class I SAM-dependent methyltransferase [Elusimicrobiota bacterium]
MNETYIKQHRYFEFRRVSFDDYKNAKLPLWIKNELHDKNAKILDYGCGFGQNLIALKNLGFKNVFGVDIEKTAIEFLQREGYCVKELDL